MNYEEAWKELIRKLKKSEKIVKELEETCPVKNEEYRLSGKLEGIKLAQGYMRDIESSIK